MLFPCGVLYAQVVPVVQFLRNVFTNFLLSPSTPSVMYKEVLLCFSSFDSSSNVAKRTHHFSFFILLSPSFIFYKEFLFYFYLYRLSFFFFTLLNAKSVVEKYLFCTLHSYQMSNLLFFVIKERLSNCLWILCLKLIVKKKIMESCFFFFFFQVHIHTHEHCM